MRPRWQSAKRPDTAIGAFVMGVRAFTPGSYSSVPNKFSRKDTRAWILGWNEAARKHGSGTRLKVPELRMKVPRKMKTPSNDTEAAVLREAIMIAKARGWYVERRNTGAIKTDTSFFRYGSPGAADLIVVVRLYASSGGYFPVHIEAEAKRRDGRGRQSESQIAFQEEMKNYGIPYFVFTSGEEFALKIDEIYLDFKRQV